MCRPCESRLLMTIDAAPFPRARGRRFGRTQISGRGVTWKLRIESWGVVFEGRPQPQPERYPRSGISATHLPTSRHDAACRARNPSHWQFTMTIDMSSTSGEAWFYWYHLHSARVLRAECEPPPSRRVKLLPNAAERPTPLLEAQSVRVLSDRHTTKHSQAHWMPPTDANGAKRGFIRA